MSFFYVPHSLLITKLKYYGFNNLLLQWFNNYLSNRLQRVTLEGYTSNYLNVLSGVPQGSILGPLLFNLYINDITTVLENSKCSTYMYADDSKISCNIKGINDCLILQDHINHLYKWCKTWGMSFSINIKQGYDFQ